MENDNFGIEILKEKGLITGGKFFPYNPKLKDRAAQMRKNQTEEESKLWRLFLKNFNKRGENKIQILRQKIIDNYIVDFYIHSIKIAIEIDGEIHNNRKEYDEIRTNILEGYGIKIIRITNNEIINNFQEICKMLEKLIKNQT